MYKFSNEQETFNFVAIARNCASTAYTENCVVSLPNNNNNKTSIKHDKGNFSCLNAWKKDRFIIYNDFSHFSTISPFFGRTTTGIYLFLTIFTFHLAHTYNVRTYCPFPVYRSFIRKFFKESFSGRPFLVPLGNCRKRNPLNDWHFNAHTYTHAIAPFCVLGKTK